MHIRSKRALKSVAAIASTFALHCTGVLAQSQAKAIHVDVASYGYAGERKDVKDDVVKYCEGKPACTFPVDNQSLGLHDPLDPSPGNPKGLIVVWQCGRSGGKTQFAEGRKATIDCP